MTRILIAEDDFICRKVLLRHLQAIGMCDTAVNGEEAVAAVEAALEEEPYDLICLDIRMPGLNGLDALERIRSLEQRAGIMPGRGANILMTTQVDDREAIMKAFRDQCEGYLLKPIEKDKLLAAVADLGIPVE